MVAEIQFLIGRHFAATSGNVCQIQKIGPGAIRAYWQRQETACDRKEFEDWVQSVLAVPLELTVNIGEETEKEAYQRWKAR